MSHTEGDPDVEGLLITGGTVFAPGGVMEGGTVLIEDGVIRMVGPADTHRRIQRGSDIVELDATGFLVIPGLIDIQVNGAAGRLFTAEPTAGTLAAMSGALASSGCTAFLPTVISAASDDMAAAAAMAALAAGEHVMPGASVLGCHLEGPFLNPERAGAHRREWLRDPSIEELRSFLDAGEGTVQVLTLAPELPGVMPLVEEATRRGARVSIGHTSATAEQAAEAVTAGASMVTHLFNAMPPLQARAPGPAGAALAGAIPFAGIIADGIHVHPANLAAAARSLGSERLVLVTDAMPAVGSDATSFDLQGRRAVMRGAACYLEDGTLAGSALRMNEAVRTMRDFIGVPEAEAIAMASINPARALGIDERKGSLAPGMDADIAVCTPDFEVLLTVVEGRIVYRTVGWEAVRA